MADGDIDEITFMQRADEYRGRMVSRLRESLGDGDRGVFIAVIDVFLPELIKMQTELTALRQEIQGTRRRMSTMEARCGLVEAKFNDFLARFTRD